MGHRAALGSLLALALGSLGAWDMQASGIWAGNMDAEGTAGSEGDSQMEDMKKEGSSKALAGMGGELEVVGSIDVEEAEEDQDGFEEIAVLVLKALMRSGIYSYC